MIEKWKILEPDEKTKKHKLLLKCELKDILSLVKNLGAICSRPERIISSDYNFVIYLLEYNKEIEEKVKKEIEKIISKNISQASKKVEEEKSKTSEIEIPIPDIEIKEEIALPKIEDVKTKKEEKTIIEPTPPPPPKPPSSPVKEEELHPKTHSQKTEVEKKDIKLTEKKEKNIIEDRKTVRQPKDDKEYDRIRLKWSIELPLNPMMSFQTLITASHNRFAHAASMSVVENPGVMYNPILIYGGIGVGKSHFIHSMSYGLSSSIGQKNIFVTNGVKFSIGVNLAIKENFIDKLEKIINECKVIIIDDLHLMLINKDNKQFISRIIDSSMKANKQVVFSSLFPPSELEPLENLLEINLSQGWMVDIKQPPPQAYRMILNQILTNMDIKLSEGDINRFFVTKLMDFKNVNKYLFRMKKFEKYLIASSNSMLHQDMLSILLGEKDDISMVNDSDLRNASNYTPSFKENKSIYKWGFFYPKGMKDYINYVFLKLDEVSKKYLSTDIGWSSVFVEEYDTDETFGLPFRIGNYLLEKNVNGLILIGPPSTSPLSAKEVEFSHLTEKIAESMNIKFGYISFTKLKGDSSYLNTILEII
jgi:chromosomal replication initiation ATPase DnaA